MISLPLHYTLSRPRCAGYFVTMLVTTTISNITIRTNPITITTILSPIVTVLFLLLLILLLYYSDHCINGARS